MSFSSQGQLLSSRIEKGFDALSIFNYFKAKELFEGSLKKWESPASYGLATIYLRTDNPFHSLDSAYSYVLRSERTYSLLKEKKKEKLKLLNLDYLNILELRASVSSGFYAKAKKENTVSSYSTFIQQNPWANELFEAIAVRDSMAYELARQKGNAAAFQSFNDSYPESSLSSIAREEFHRLQYLEMTQSNQLVAYLDFLKKCPSNPYTHQAEDRVYEIVTVHNTVESYYSFIQAYPSNRNVGPAWRKLYQLYMTNFTDERLEEFKKDFPTYPYWDELEADRALMKLNLLPFKQENLYGFMDHDGKVIIPAQYEQLGFYREGLALAMKNGLYGYIDKGNRTVIPFEYTSGTDFEEGRAVVERSGLYGMIDRTGNAVFKVRYTDLGTVSEDLVYANADSLYGYYDRNGNVRIAPKFNEAYPFSKGIAKVQSGENQAYIDIYGTFVVAPGYSEISFFNDSLRIFEEDDMVGLMRKNCRVVVPAEFEEIGQLSVDRALVVKNDLIGYIDGAGKQIIQNTYEMFPNYLKRGQFNSNMAIVKQKGKFGAIDLNGKVAIPISFTEIGDISALTAFTKGKGWGFMDLTGKVIIQPTYDYAESFKDGQAIVEKMTLQGVIDSKGNEIIPITYTSVSRLTKDLFLVSNGSHFGILSSKGEQVVPVSYQQIRVLDKDFVLLMNNNEVHYLSLSGKKIIQPNLSGE